MKRTAYAAHCPATDGTRKTSSIASGQTHPRLLFGCVEVEVKMVDDPVTNGGPQLQWGAQEKAENLCLHG